MNLKAKSDNEILNEISRLENSIHNKSVSLRKDSDRRSDLEDEMERRTNLRINRESIENMMSIGFEISCGECGITMKHNVYPIEIHIVDEHVLLHKPELISNVYEYSAVNGVRKVIPAYDVMVSLINSCKMYQQGVKNNYETALVEYGQMSELISKLNDVIMVEKIHAS
jgi:hypothetical protein